jgi:hypothetical protein
MTQRSIGTSTGALIPIMPISSRPATNRANGLWPPAPVPRSIRRITAPGSHADCLFPSRVARITCP